MRALLRCLMIAGFLWAVTVSPLPAQESSPNESIFNRFSQKPSFSGSRMSMFEVPFRIRPQTNPDADIEENLGFGYVHSFFPSNIIFTSFGFNLARMEWRPKNTEIESEEVKQFDITMAVNFRIKKLMILSFGTGLGIADGLVVFSDGAFAHNLVPYIPFQLGVILPLGPRARVGLRVAITPYFGDGPVIGNTRLLAGVGFVY